MAERRVLWLDVSAGVAGDMLLAALLDAGAPLDTVQEAVDAVVPGAVRLATTPTTRAGLRAVGLTVELRRPDQPERRWSDIRQLLAAAPLDDDVRAAATAVFGALAEAEGRVHGVAPDDVHFHEVGAWDAIADVVGVCAALRALDVGRIVVGELALGSGTVPTRHGLLPVPVPAVLELVRGRGVTVTAGGDGELATPTGVALLTALAGEQGPAPRMTVDRIGVGAGGRERPGRANVVRAVLGDAVRGVTTDRDHGEPALEPMVVVETTVDDLDPRIWPTVVADLLAAGAADAWLTPVLMKKGRPGQVLSVLATPDLAPAVRRLVLERTSTLGVRQYPVGRETLGRVMVAVEVPGLGRAAVKVAVRDGRIVHATPEFDDVAALASAAGRPVREALEATAAAAVATGLTPGSAPPPPPTSS